MPSARHDPRLEALLRALRPGQRMWLTAGGQSLWPLVLDGDQVQVERSASLSRGDIALVMDVSGALVAHLVHALDPVVTMSSVGRLDAPAAEVFGRVVALRRSGLTVPIPRAAHLALRLVPSTATALRRVPGLAALVRLLRS